MYPDKHDCRIIQAKGGNSFFYYQPIMAKDITILGFNRTKRFIRGIVCGKLGYSARERRFRLSENGCANPLLRPTIAFFSCNEEREGWIKDKFAKEHIPNYMGYGEVYLYSKRFHTWLQWANKNLK